jgi:arylsulfatase A-like enzyme
MRGKGCNAYREQNHVPLMIVHPAYPGGASVKVVSSHVDVAPTLLALTGMPADALGRVSAGLRGRDLSKTLSAPAQASLTTVRPAALFNYNMFTYLVGMLRGLAHSFAPRCRRGRCWRRWR